MTPVRIDISANIQDLSAKLTEFARRQIPFATAQALTAVAKNIQAAEQKNMQAVLDRPTPFTLRSVKVISANKRNPVATVFVQDIAAKYLEPYEFGGVNKLNSRALLAPRDLRLNQYGNLPHNKLKNLKAKPNTFIGRVKTQNGIVSGVWQRMPPSKGKPGGLKLLIKFEDAHPVHQHLDYFGVARNIVSKTFRREMGRAMARAVLNPKR